MTGWDPLLLVVLACLAVLVLGPAEYVSLAAFGIMGAIAAVLLAGRGDLALPVFALAGAGAVLLGVRTLGRVAGLWDQPRDPANGAHRVQPREQREDVTDMDNRIWR